MGGSGSGDYHNQIDSALQQANTPKSDFAKQYSGFFQGGGYSQALAGLLNGGAIGNAFPGQYGMAPANVFNQNQPKTGGGQIQGTSYGGIPNYQPMVNGQPNVPGYTGGFTPSYQSAFNGLDPKNFSPGTTFGDLLKQGQVSQSQVNQFFGQPSDYNPLTDPDQKAQYDKWVSAYSGNPGTLSPSGTNATPYNSGNPPPDFASWENQYGINGSNFSSSFSPNDPMGFQNAQAKLSANAPPNGGSMQNGQYFVPNQNQDTSGLGLGVQNQGNFASMFPQIAQASSQNIQGNPQAFNSLTQNNLGLVDNSQINPQNSQYFKAIQDAMAQQYSLGSKNLQAQFGAAGGASRGTPAAFAQAQYSAQALPQLQQALGAAYNQDFQNQLGQRSLALQGNLGAAGLNQSGANLALQNQLGFGGLNSQNSQFNAGQTNSLTQQYMAMLQAANQQQIQNQFTGYQNFAQLASALAGSGIPGGSANVNLGGQSQSGLQQLAGLL